MFRKIGTYLLYTMLFLGVLALAAFSNDRHSNNAIKGLAISVSDYDELKFINQEMLKKMVELSYDSIYTINKERIDVAKLEQSIEGMNSVKNAEVYIDVSGELSVVITQRMPIGRVINKKFSYYIDENGYKMGLSQVFTANVPLVYGSVKDENADEIYNMLKYIKGSEVLREQIVSLSVAKNDEFELRTRKGNTIIEFGKSDKMEEKFEKLLVYYRKTVTEFGWDRYRKINLEFANQVVCTKK